MIKYVYDAWGHHEVKVLDSACIALSQLNPFRYRGYYYDTETGLYFLKTRYYDPEVCRFITIDDLQYLDPEHINGLNLYAYCGNNPVMNVDPSGRIVISAFTLFLISSIAAGVIFGGCISGYTAYTEGANALGIFGAILGGAILGGAMGAVMVIGGAAGLASLGVATTVVGGSSAAALSISIGIGIGAGLLSYTVETLLRDDKKWDGSDLIISGILGGCQAFTTFLVAFAGGRAGVFTHKLTNMSPFDFFQYVIKSTGTVSYAQSIVYSFQVLFSNTIAQFLLTSLPAIVLRSLIKKFMWVHNMRIQKDKDMIIKIAWIIIGTFTLLGLLTYALGRTYTLKFFFLCIGVVVALALIVWLVCLLIIKFGKKYYLIDEHGIKLYKNDELLFELKNEEMSELNYIRFRWNFLLQIGSGFLNVSYPCKGYNDKNYSMVFPTGKAIHPVSMSLKQAKEVALILGKYLVIK